VANAGFGDYLGTIRNTGNLYQIRMSGRNVSEGTAGTLLPPSGLPHNALVTYQFSIKIT